MITRDSVLLAQSGDIDSTNEIIAVFYNIASDMSKKMFPPREVDDAIQSGIIKVYTSIQQYDPKKNMGPIGFFYMSLRAGLINYMRYVNRQKFQLSNDAVRLDSDVYSNDRGDTKHSVIASKYDVEADVISKMTVEFLRSNLQLGITELERNVVNLRLQGKSYKDIARIMNIGDKSVDNALARVRKRVKRIIMIDQYGN